MVNSQVSEFSVSIKCCIVQDPLNAIRGDESMPGKYYRGIHFFVYVYVAKIISAWLEIVGKLFFLKVHGMLGILPNRLESGVPWMSHMPCFWNN